MGGDEGKLETLDSRTRTTTSTRHDLKFFRVFSPWKASLQFFFTQKRLALLSLPEELKPSPGRKM